MTKKLYEADPKDIAKLWDRMIDWLLFNQDEIKSYIGELTYIGSGVVFGNGASTGDASIELNVIALDEAGTIIGVVEKAISKLEPDDFDIYIDRYHREMIYSRIAEWEDIAEITVKRRIKRIRETVKQGFYVDDIDLEILVRLKEKLRYICRKKVA